MRAEFWAKICEFEEILQIALGILGVLLVMALVSIVLVRPGTGAYVISVLNLVLLIPLVGLCTYSLRRCSQRRSERRSG